MAEKTLFKELYPDHIVDEIDEQLCRQYEQEYEQIRYDQGTINANRIWFTKHIEQWTALLNDADVDSFDIDRDVLCRMAVCFTVSLALRDSLIISIVVSDQYWNDTILEQLAVYPHDPRSSCTMSALLNQSFDDPQQYTEPARVNTAILVCERIAEIVPARFAAMAFAIAAYGAWWIRDPRALSLATLALNLNEELSLANIVKTAILRDVYPAWHTPQLTRE